MGIDASLSSIEFAEKHQSKDPSLSSSSLQYACTSTGNKDMHVHIHKCIFANVERLGTAHREAFDVVLALEVIEHVEDPRLFLSSIASLIKVFIIAGHRFMFGFSQRGSWFYLP